MRFTFLIFSIIIASICFGQDSLLIDSTAKSTESSFTKTKKSRKKSKKLKQVNTADTISKENIIAPNYKEKDDNTTTIVYPILFIAIISIIGLFILIAKRSRSKFEHENQYDYYKNEYLKSLGWKRNGETNPKRDELLRQFESLSERQAYYRNEYLQSEAWQRKRYVVLKRDNWQCVYCGGRATQVHHKKYAKYNIGKEPIDWLVSVCKPCHDRIHNQ